MALVKATPAFRARADRLAPTRGDVGRLVQTTLRRAWQDRDHFPADSPVDAWLATVLERQIRPSTQI
jgi:DNA-directed RNA polymerase specialized sigma24 family protein